jgi:hypothetical protein
MAHTDGGPFVLASRRRGSLAQDGLLPAFVLHAGRRGGLVRLALQELLPVGGTAARHAARSAAVLAQ